MKTVAIHRADCTDANPLEKQLAALPAETIIRIGAGVYPTPMNQIKPKSRQQLVGAGNGKTTLEWDGQGEPGDFDNLIDVESADDVVVRELICDFRSDKYPNTPTRGIVSHDSNHLTVADVRLTRMANSRLIEKFPIAFFARSKNVTGGLIERCEIDHVADSGGGMGGCTGIIAGMANTDLTVAANCVVRQNYIHDVAGIGLGMAGSHGCHFYENVVENALYGFNRDTARGSQDLFEKNFLLACAQYGFVWKSDASGSDDERNASSGLVVRDNFISITGERNDSAVLWLSGASIKNSTLQNNRLVCLGTPTSYMRGLIATCGPGTRVTGNRSSNGMEHKIGPGIALKGNTSFDGTPWAAPSAAGLTAK